MLRRSNDFYAPRRHTVTILAKLLCFIFGHRYQVAQEFSPWSRRVVCAECRGDWGMNDQVPAFIDWSEDLADLYRGQGHVVFNPWPVRHGGDSR